MNKRKDSSFTKITNVHVHAENACTSGLDANSAISRGIKTQETDCLLLLHSHDHTSLICLTEYVYNRYYR